MNHAAVDRLLDDGVPAPVIAQAAAYQCRQCGAVAGVCWDEHAQAWVAAARHRTGCGYGRRNLAVKLCTCRGCTEGSAP
jgi:hypothetical protein